MATQAAASMNTFITINGKVVRSTASGFTPQLLILTQNPILPTGTVQSFTSTAEVEAYFGTSTNANDSNNYYIDSVNAAAYFSGSINKGTGKKPASVLFYYYPASNTPAFTRGSSLNVASNLSSLQAVTAGTLNITFNGTPYVASGINLSSAGSFSAMAAIIQTAVQAVSGLGTATVTYSTINSAFTLKLPYSGANTITYIADSGTGSTDQLAQKMLITEDTGAIISQGIPAQTPAQVMDAVTNLTQNFATFICNFEISVSGYATVLGLTAWTEAQINFYLPIFYDRQGGTTSPITAPMRQALIDGGYGQDSVTPWTLSANVMDMIVNADSIPLPFAVAGVVASYNFDTINGVIQLNATTFTGILPVITNNTDLDLLLNTFGTNSYVNLNTRANNFQWFETGIIGGNYGWIDTLIGYIWLADECQVRIANLMQNSNSIPYNNLSVINATLEPIFKQGLSNGTVQNSIPLSADQKQELIEQAGYDISTILFNIGYYIPIIRPSSTDISTRTLSNVNAWYTYAGGPIYVTINLTTVE